MLMVFGIVAMLALAVFSLLGAVVLVVALVLLFRSRSRKSGAMVLVVGAGGAAVSVLGFVALQAMLGASSSVDLETLLVFGAAGFGAGGAIALLVVALLGFLGQPTNGSRRRGANA